MHDDVPAALKEHLATMSEAEIRWAVAYYYTESKKFACEVTGIKGHHANHPDFISRATKLIELFKQNAIASAATLINNASIKAAAQLIRQLDSPDAKQRQFAIKEILDRSLGKPVTRSHNKNENDNTFRVEYVGFDPSALGPDPEAIDGEIIEDE